jgi:hypothetical protein
MGMTAYHRAGPATSLGATRPLPVPAIAVFYGAGGLDHVDSLVLNHLAAAALEELAGTPMCGTEVELLHDPQTGEGGIKPWVIGRPLATLHHVHPTRFRGTSDHDEWGTMVRAAWPVKIEAPQFLGTWKVPPVSLARPAAVDVRDGMLVFHPARMVTRR